MPGRRRCTPPSAGGGGRTGSSAAVRIQPGVERVHGVALQAADLDGLPVVAVQHAGAFAQHVHRADARAAQPQNVGVENGRGRAAQVAGSDLLDEARHVDVGGAGPRARRVEAEQAAIGFGQGRLLVERRMQFGEPLQIARNGRAGREAADASLIARSRPPRCARRQALVQQLDELVHVAAADVHRRRNAQHVAVHAALAENAGGSRARLPERRAVSAGAGVLVWRSSTSSSACIRPMPRTSPMISCFSLQLLRRPRR